MWLTPRERQPWPNAKCIYFYINLIKVAVLAGVRWKARPPSHPKGLATSRQSDYRCLRTVLLDPAPPPPPTGPGPDLSIQRSLDWVHRFSKDLSAVEVSFPRTTDQTPCPRAEAMPHVSERKQVPGGDMKRPPPGSQLGAPAGTHCSATLLLSN